MHAHSRSMATLAASLAAVLAAFPIASGELGAQTVADRAAGARFTVELQNLTPSMLGPLKSVEGGYAYGDVVVEPRRGDMAGGKHLGAVRWAPLELVVSPATATQLLEAGLTGKPIDGRLVTGDALGRTTGGMEFKQAAVTRIAFAALDAASKEACYVAVDLAPAQATSLRDGGPMGAGSMGVKQKPALCSSFRVQLGDLPMNRVARVDSIVMTRPVVESSAGTMREGGMRAAGEWNARNVTLTISEADYAPIAAWYEDFVVKGNNAAANEKTLEVTFLGPDLKSELLTLRATGVGAVALRRRYADEAIRRFELELYVEKWEVVPGKGM